MTLFVVALALAPAAARAAAPTGSTGPAGPSAPVNDDRANATVITSLPSTQTSSTAGATREPTEPSAPCGCNDGSLWYRYVAVTNGTLTVQLTAADPLDATLDAYLQDRSRLTVADSDQTDQDGKASLRFAVRAGRSYLIRVAQEAASDPGGFVLAISAAAPEVRPPGANLAPAGVTETLDRVLKPVDVFHTRFREGRTYRIAMAPVEPPAPPKDPNNPDSDDSDDDATPPCRVVLSVYGPNASDFSGEPVVREACDGYVLFTPARGGSGRYTFRVSTPAFTRGAQRFHLQVAAAGRTDTAPGVFLDNHRTVHGALRGTGVNRVDLYRFTVKTRSRLNVAVDGSEDLEVHVRNDRGFPVASGTDVRRDIRPGRYFVSVEAPAGTNSRYTVRRSSRAITRLSAAISGVSRARGHLGQALTVSFRVRPGVGGTVRATLQRFDPEFGWQYVRTVRVRAGAGRASFAFVPPSVGRFRVSADYLGTRDAAPSSSGFAQVLVTARGG